MNRNLVGNILGKSSIKIAHLFPIRYQTWPPQAILVSGWLISKKSSPLKLYKECAFSSHPLINMAATGHSCF